MVAGRDEPVQKKLLFKVPTYQDVLEKSQPQPLPSLFRPSSSSSSSTSLPAVAGLCSSNPSSSYSSSSFNEAFSFVKQTEFYTAPPAPPPQPQPSSSSEPPLLSCPGNFPQDNHSVSRNGIIVSRRQQGNPLLKHVRNVRWTFGDIIPDYLLGHHTCALYISLRYHLLHPDYIYYRIRELQKCFRLRIVVCHIDVEDVVKPLHEVTRTALFHDCTLLCGWSLEECARYLETIKAYENKPADIIQERLDNDYLSRLTNALTSVRRVNKSDVVTLGSNFGTLAGIIGASMEDLARCPGIGERKVKRLYETFHEPFRRSVRNSHASNTLNIQSQVKNKRADHEELKDKSDHTEALGSDLSQSDANGGKNSEASVRSALDAAYAKYWKKPKIQKKGQMEKDSNTGNHSEEEGERQDTRIDDTVEGKLKDGNK